MRWAFIACLLVGCHESAQGPCSVDELANGDVSGSLYANCGTFSAGSPNYTDEAMVAAQLCVLNAVKNSGGFLLVYDAADSTGALDTVDNLRAGWSGAAAQGVLAIRSYAGSGSAGDMSMKKVSERACTSVVATDSCTPNVGVPCLTCAGATPGAITCQR